MKSLSYNLLPDIVSQCEKLSNDSVTRLYFRTIYDAMDKIKESNIDAYKNTCNLHDKYWNSRCFYFNSCRFLIKIPFIFSLLIPILNRFYSRAIRNMDKFFRNLQEFTSDDSFYDKICTIEFMMWRKRIDYALGSAEPEIEPS